MARPTAYQNRPGGGMFTMPDGSQQFMLDGPLADGWRRGIDAGQSGIAPIAGVQWGPNGESPEQLNPELVPEVKPVGGAGQAAPAAAEQQPEPTAEQAPLPVFTGDKGSQLHLLPGKDPNDPNSYVRYVPGSAASPGGLAERTRTVRGGYDENPEYEEQLANAAIDKRLAVQQQSDALAEQSEADQALLKQHYGNLKEQETEALKDRQEAEKRVAEYQTKHNEMAEEFRTARVDPSREMKGVKGLGYALAAAAGAFASTIAKTPNYALDIMNSAIERDVRAQEQEIAVKGKAADNMLAKLNREYGNLDMAKSSYRAIQKEAVKNQADMIATKSRDKQAQANALQVSAGISEDLAKDLEQYRLGAAGEVTKNMVNTPKTSGSKGGYAPVSLDDAKKIKSLSASNQTRGQVNKQQKLADVDAAEAGLARLEQTFAKHGRPSVVTTGYLGSDQSQELGASVEALAPGLGRALEGNAPNESTMAGIRSGLLSADPTKTQAAIDSYRQQLKDRRAAITSSPEAEDEISREESRE